MRTLFLLPKNICLTFILLFIYIIGRKTPRCCTPCCTALHTFWVKGLKVKEKDVVLRVVLYVVLACCDFWNTLRIKEL